MATLMKFFTNYVDSLISRTTTPANYIEVDLVNDELIWTQGNTVVKDLMTHEPTSNELNVAGVVISEIADVTVPLCLLMDYSHDIGGSYYTHKVKGMSENKRFVFCFAFDNPTATEPQLEAWDDSSHTTFTKNVLGAGTPANSMIKAVCTTAVLPGTNWAGAPIAGDSNVVLLNSGLGALLAAADLYANIKIVIPTAFATPGVENFVLTVRYTWA